MLFYEQLVLAVVVEKWTARGVSATLHRALGIGRTQHYHSVQKPRHFCGMLKELTFLPTDEVQEGMEWLKTITTPEADELVDCFDTAYSYVSGSYSSRQLEDSQGIRLLPVPLN